MGELEVHFKSEVQRREEVAKSLQTVRIGGTLRLAPPHVL
jgi:hypothetical protein